MNNFIENLSPKEWESFCEKMLRHHFGSENFWSVPDEDSGDCGIEFFTANGIIFQCYYPVKKYEMNQYKEKIKGKINDDLKKLKEYEEKIKEILDKIIIHQWILLTPENKSKDLIAYCNKKKREVLKKDISFIDNVKFSVKIETAESYYDSMIYAIKYDPKIINIPFVEIDRNYIAEWKSCNSEFLSNVSRKSNALMEGKQENFQELVVKKYIQIEGFIDNLRDEHPDICNSVEDTALARLEDIRIESTLSEGSGNEYIKKIIEENTSKFSKYSEFMSDSNTQILAFGFLSKWIAQCFMDFE